jgi:hypothetical protein
MLKVIPSVALASLLISSVVLASVLVASYFLAGPEEDSHAVVETPALSPIPKPETPPRRKVLIPVFNPKCGIPMPTVQQYREVFADELEAAQSCANQPYRDAPPG